jgi:hypothetical protein
MTSRAPTRNNPALPRNASTSLDAPPSRPTAASSTTSNNIRRNLFPQAAAAAAAARRQLAPSSSSTSTVHHSSSNSSNDSSKESNDIIIRDASGKGGFTIDAPQFSSARDMDLEDEELEARRRMIEGWRKLGGDDDDDDGMVDQSGELLYLLYVKSTVQSLYTRVL